MFQAKWNCVYESASYKIIFLGAKGNYHEPSLQFKGWAIKMLSEREQADEKNREAR